MSCNIDNSVLEKPLNEILSCIELQSNLVPIGYSKNDHHLFKTDAVLNEGQKNVVSEIKTNSILLHLPTGFGKTILGIILAACYEDKILILVPRKIIFDQWINQIKRFAPSRIKDFEVRLEISFFKRLTSEVRYSCVVVDECHMNERLVFGQLLPRIETDSLIGLSASPINDSIFYNHFFKQTIYRHQTRPFFVFPVFLSFIPKVFFIWRNGKRTFDYTKILRDVTKNVERLEYIEQYIRQVYSTRPFQSLIIAKNISTVEYLAKNLSEIATIDTLYGKKTVYDKNATILIGTYQKMSVGFDTFVYKNLFLLDNLKDIIQPEGRLRNSLFHLYDFVDNHFLFKNHWNGRLEWYRKRGAELCT